MDASDGGHRHFGRGLGLGFLTGTLGGIWLGANGQHGEARVINEMGGAIAGALAGVVVGSIVGFAWHSERWTPVTLPPG